jgi:hypothetical protein
MSDKEQDSNMDKPVSKKAEAKPLTEKQKRAVALLANPRVQKRKTRVRARNYTLLMCCECGIPFMWVADECRAGNLRGWCGECWEKKEGR